MPFTPSHAVVALPFARTPLLPAAIAVGAMTPDLPLFLRGTPLTYQATHTNVLLSGLLALVLLVLWYALLRPAVRELSPDALARRLPPEWDVPTVLARAPGRGIVAHTVLLVSSLLIGVTSHIAWDAFTHEGRWGVRLVPLLGQQWGPLVGYKWLQHGSGAVALVILAVFAVHWLLRAAPSRLPVRRLATWVRWVWWLSLPAALVLGWGIGLAVFGPFRAEWTAQHLAYRVLPPACAAWALLTLAMCVVLRIRPRVLVD